ncbi:MAG: valine--tRNA ligase [Candidatus Pelagibacter sp. TMED64]|nr:valine--tRNA ligase [Candidatus Pelagibacter sp.]OUU66084.1 MAG: valine--tRNA ligase [Candidatus Pelagibacter sp. TMED64]|tara:strand:+ start:113 stop:2758 length:2646 start_codon:yes stop_codon:yes gene_type:complete
MQNSNYDHITVENEIYSYWEKNNFFKPKKNKKKYFSIVIPPPNVTGSLHMGHALNNSIQDLLIRFYRMNGYETLWQPGTDHAGIATQAVVEKKLLKDGISRKNIGRENFIKEVWKWKKESGDKIENQLKKLGCSCDWSRTRFTMDEDLSKAVIKTFVELYKKKIIYKDTKLVNWDTKLETAISDLEVEQKEMQSNFYYIKYKIIGEVKPIIIATTRPETLLGDTALAVNPADKRYKKFIGYNALVPIIERKIKIISDNYVDMKQGSGALKITPAHDFNDFELGKKHNLEFINIFEKNGKLNNNTPKEFQGLDRFDARKKIVDLLKNQDLLERIENIKNVIPYGDRSNSIIEPLLTEQWFANAKFLSKKAKAAVKNKKTNFFPINWTKTYFQWMDKIQPWCISRQLWWGHRIPAWYSEDKKIFVAENETEAKKNAFKYYKKNVSLKRDNDVLDTWFSSALWPFATLGWPSKTYELKRFYPTSILVTGFDIIFFWVARMMMMGNFLLKKSPFSKVYVHALVRDEKGQKMSKSKGNVIDPLDIIKNFGADSLRFTLISMAAPGRDVKLSEDRVKGYRNFLNKIWNANKFSQLNKCKLSKKFDIKKSKMDINKWIYFELLLTQKKAEEFISNFRFDEAAKTIYQFVWGSYCDWYIEFLKPVFDKKEKKQLEESRQFASYIESNILILLHPFIPFFTEKLWLSLKYDVFFKTSLINKKWNLLKKPDISFKKSHHKITWLTKLITTIRSTKSELDITPGAFVDISINELQKDKRNIIFDNIEVFKRLGRVTNVYNSQTNKNGITILIDVDSVTLYFDENIDFNDLKIKVLSKIKLLNDKLLPISRKLKNNSFLKNAPKLVVQKEKKALLNYNIELKKLNSILNSIKE